MPVRAIVLLSFCLALCLRPVAQNPSGKTVADKIAAIVGDHIILSSEIENSLDDLSRQNIPIPPNAVCILTKQAIVTKLLMLQALKDSLPITDEDVEMELNRRIEYFKRQGSELGEQEIQKIRKDLGPQLKELMLAQAMREKITGNIKVTPSEVQAFFNLSKDSLPTIGEEVEVGEIRLYPAASSELERYVISELNDYKRQVENKTVSFCQLDRIAGHGEACNDLEVNRNSKNHDPVFLSAAFHLKNGEISAPVKCKVGFFLIQMLERNGDDALVRYIFRAHPVTDAEINQAKGVLNKVRSDITENRISFNEAAVKFNDALAGGPFLMNNDGSSNIAIEDLEPEMAETIKKLDAGEVSRPLFFTDQRNIKAVRLVFLKSRTEAHILNMRQDYVKISQMALEAKREQILDNWLKERLPLYYIMIDKATSANCPEIRGFATVD